MVKRYISLNSLNLVTDINVGENRVSIRFKGGRSTPNRINGSYITEDKSIQKAIEADSAYGKSFLEYDTKPKKKVKKVSEEIKSKSIDIPDIKTKQMAIEWISQNLSVDLAQNLSALKIRQFAISQGYDFPLLKLTKN